MTKTILTPSDTRELVYFEQMKKENANHAEDTELLSLSSALKEETDQQELLLLELKKNLDPADYKIYSRMFSFPAFLSEILTFAKECAMYGIPADQLPVRNDAEEELKRIVSLALTLDLSEKRNLRLRESRVNALKERNDLLLGLSFEKDMYHYRIMKELREVLPSQKEDHSPVFSLCHALNPRQEIEAIAQDIIRRNVSVNVILTDPSSALPVVKQVFGRYEIPFSCTHEDLRSKSADVFEALADLALHKDADHLLEAAKLNAFPVSCPDDVLAYLAHTMTDLTLPETVSEIMREGIFKSDAQRFEKKEKRAAAWYQAAEEEIRLLISSDSPKQILANAFECLRKAPCVKERTELENAMRIRTILTEVIPLAETEDDVRFVIEAIRMSGKSIRTFVTDRVIVTDLTRPVRSTDVSYIVGCSGKSYPGFNAGKGLFDENYLKDVPGYPSMNERFEAYMEQLEWIRHSALSEVIWSYAENDYQGREIPLAFEVESMFEEQQKQKWQIDTLRPAVLRGHVLSPETAKKLFADEEGKITGSISTIERWFNCPYLYFIQSGLKVRLTEDPGLESNFIGTIQHAVMEESQNEHGKAYAEITEEEIRSRIAPAFESMRRIRPHETALINLTEERMADGLITSFRFLKEFEKHTSFQPAAAEEKFEKEEIAPGILLRGTIDRVDTYGEEMFRIIDYKSSDHALSDTKVRSGLQLQLLSYLMTAQKKRNALPAGSYYYSLKNKDIPVKAASLSRNAVKETDLSEEALNTQFTDSHKLAGWTYTNRTTELDESGSYIKSLTAEYDYEAVKQCITEVYEFFRDSVLNGDIRLDPIEGACTFCDYRSICRFHGQYRKPKPVSDAVMKKGKVKEDAV